ncbi:PEP-CTERM sorting domain-containing protein [bacterium]|nr:PEP-CTERM sorting domain-containing protein [bacterium]
MKNTKKILVNLLFVLLFVSVASYSYATSFQFNINGTGPGTAVTVNSFFDTTGTAEIFNDFTGSTPTFKEVGTFYSGGMDGTSAYPVPWGSKQLTAVFEADGYMPNTHDGTFTFNPGGTLEMYVDDGVTGTPYADTADGGAADPLYGANTGTSIATWNLLSGGGKLGDNWTPDKNGTITVSFVADSITAGYFFDNNGNDLNAWTTSQSSPILTIGLSTTNAHVIDPPNQGFAEEINELSGYTVPVDGGGAYVNDLDATNGYQTFNVSSNGQWEISVVPEPATMLLLGSGLIGLAGFGRKKKFFKKD